MEKQSLSQLERERVRREIARLTEEYIRTGGQIRRVQPPANYSPRLVGRAWSGELFN